MIITIKRIPSAAPVIKIGERVDDTISSGSEKENHNRKSKKKRNMLQPPSVQTYCLPF